MAADRVVDRDALMAGAASGIGAATAHRLALEGATVVLGRDGGWSIVKESA